MADLYRAQVLLERKQHEALQALAAAEGRSMSMIIREVVAEYLIERNEEQQRQNWKDTLEELAKIREEIQTKHGILPDEFFLRDRDEREDELWQRMTGEA